MLRTDLQLGDVPTTGSVYRWSDGELVQVAGEAPGPLLAFVPDCDERGRREREMLALLRHPGVPECRRTLDSGAGATALVFEDAGDARPLALVHDLPEPALRAGLVALLGTLRYAHSRGVVHRRIDRGLVLVDPSGRFWLTGWADAVAVAEAAPPASVLSDVSADLRDLGRAFREALLRRPWPDPAGAKIHERDPRKPAGQELIDAGVKIDRDFARVLSRLVADDPREAYAGAADVLADVGASDLDAFDPWDSVTPIGARRDVARVMRLLDSGRSGASESPRRAASIEFVAPDGAGKSRLLSEIARVGRARDVIVLTAQGGGSGPWGGVGVLVRQLVQLLGREDPACVRHEEALRRLTENWGFDPRVDDVVAECSDAATDLVRAAFGRTAGLLLLDDEDRLPGAARLVWRSIGRNVHAADAGGPMNALLVSTSARPHPRDADADRLVVELPSWRPRDIETFLARAFGSPGGTRDAGAAIHRITGGRPGEVVGYLRELERRGVLLREGLRWSPAAPLSALPALPDGVADQVRRALDAAGRDAVALAETLAVAGDVALRREAVGDLSELRGPRLAAAAEAAVAAGLIESDGASWRVRTEAIRHKVYAAISDGRRRVLHREILTQLLDVSPDAIDSIATHARAGADPRAEAWTRQAVERARDACEWDVAIRHLEEAATMVGPAFTGPEVDLQRGELLTSAGRLAEAMDVLESLLSRTAAGGPLEADVCLALARACYDAREWERVLAVRLPETNARGEQLAEMRYVRAAAMEHLHRSIESQREARLANAEVDGVSSVAITFARLEHDYLRSMYADDIDGIRRHLLSKLRIGVRLKFRHRYVADLIKLANAQRALRGPSPLVHKMLVRAVYVCRATPGISGLVQVSLRTALGFATVDSPRHRQRLFARAHQFALQTGLGPYAVATRIRLIASSCEAGRSDYNDKQYVRRYAVDLDRLTRTELRSVSIDLATCLLYYGFQNELERLLSRSRAENSLHVTMNNVSRLAMVGRVMFDDDVSDLLPPAERDLCVHVSQVRASKDSSLTSHDQSLAIVAHFVMRAGWGNQDWPTDLTVAELLDLIQRAPRRAGARRSSLCPSHCGSLFRLTSSSGMH